jgi:hypothetical protein
MSAADLSSGNMVSLNLLHILAIHAKVVIWVAICDF